MCSGVDGKTTLTTTRRRCQPLQHGLPTYRWNEACYRNMYLFEKPAWSVLQRSWAPLALYSLPLLCFLSMVLSGVSGPGSGPAQPTGSPCDHSYRPRLIALSSATSRPKRVNVAVATANSQRDIVAFAAGWILPT